MPAVLLIDQIYDCQLHLNFVDRNISPYMRFFLMIIFLSISIVSGVDASAFDLWLAFSLPLLLSIGYVISDFSSKSTVYIRFPDNELRLTSSFHFVIYLYLTLLCQDHTGLPIYFPQIIIGSHLIQGWIKNYQFQTIMTPLGYSNILNLNIKP